MRIELWADVTDGWAGAARGRIGDALTLWTGEDAEVVWRPVDVDPTRPHTEAHRLVALAEQEGGPRLQEDVAQRLLKAHLIEARDLTDPDVLGELAVEAGYADGPMALSGEDGTLLLREELLRGKALGVTGSPTIAVGQRLMSGTETPERIVELLRDSIDEPPLPDEVRRLRYAELLLTRKDPLGSLTMLGPLLETHKGDPNVRMLAARAYFASAQLHRAEALLTELVAADPGDFYARHLLGRTLHRLGRHEDAAPHLALTAFLDESAS